MLCHIPGAIGAVLHWKPLGSSDWDIMTGRVGVVFDDALLVEMIRRRPPHIFHYAERDSSRAGKVGMEAGSLRERVLVALLIYRFGRENVETEVSITEHEVDVRLFGEGLSIKTLTTSTPRIAGVKAIWTIDPERSTDFIRHFPPRCDYLVALVVWNDRGGLAYLPLEAQVSVPREPGPERYLKPPRRGTNPRGVEISAEAMGRLVNQADARGIPIDWKRPSTRYDPYERWVEYWKLD